MGGLDAFDRRILSELQRDGRVCISELAERVGLSTSPCWRRVKALEESGVISGYAAIVDPAALGLGLNVFVSATIDLHNAERFEAAVAQRPEVVECFAMTGEQDYLLHVQCRDIDSFDRFLRHELIHLPGVRQVRSSFALKKVKSTSRSKPAAVPVKDS